MIKYIELKDRFSNKIKLSVLGLGSWQFGGLNFLDGKDCGWQNIDLAEIETAVLFAIDNGINHIDTADCYGISEEIIGKILSKSSKRNSVKIATKIGFVKNNFQNAYCKKNLELQFEKSLKNLKKDFIDIFYFHNSDFGENDKYLDEALEFAEKMRFCGKILLLGLSCYKTNDFLRLIPKINPDIIQGKANLLNSQFITENSLVAQLIKKNNIKFFAFSPFEHGLLLNKYKDIDAKNYFSCGDHRKNLKKFEPKKLKIITNQLEKIGEKFGAKTSDFVKTCLDFLFYHKCVSSVLFGFRNKKQVEIILKYLYKIKEAKNICLEEKIDFIKNCLKK